MLEGGSQMGGIQVGNEMHPHAFQCVMVECGAHHGRAKVRTTDTDVDHVADRLAGMSPPAAIVDGFDKVLHPFEHHGDFALDIHPLHHQLWARRRAQRHMQNRAPLGEIDALAAAHGIAHRFQIGLARQLHQMTHRFGGNAILRVVEQQVAAAQGQVIEAMGVLAECRAHVKPTHGFEVLFEDLPGGQLFERCHRLAVWGMSFKGIISRLPGCR